MSTRDPKVVARELSTAEKKVKQFSDSLFIAPIGSTKARNLRIKLKTACEARDRLLRESEQS